MRHVLLAHDGYELTRQEADDILEALIAKLNEGVSGFHAEQKRAEMDKRVRLAWHAVEQDFKARSIRI